MTCSSNSNLTSQTNQQESEKMTKPHKKYVKPRTHLYEVEQGFYLLVALPHIDQQALHLETEGSILKLKAEGENFIYQRHFEFSKQIEWDEIKATWRAGLLHVELKQAQPTRRKIEVQSA